MKPSRQQALRKLLLFKDLEKEGIGRPSTYATIIGTIQERGYVRKDGNTALVPSYHRNGRCAIS
jgi:DNA topoisomerase IA